LDCTVDDRLQRRQRGSGNSACSKAMLKQDALPKASIQALCEGIAATPGYTCSFDGAPTSGHIECGIDKPTMSSCHDWFDAQLKTKG
jgi:hypothetical protein